MNKKVNKLIRVVVSTLLILIMTIAIPKVTKADAASDALAAQQALLAQQQVALFKQQQAELYKQQMVALAAYQQALLVQQQQAMADQYAKALFVFEQQQLQQQRAIQQMYMLNSIQQAQKAQFESMLDATHNEYKGHILDNYIKYQQQAMTAFKGYEGLK